MLAAYIETQSASIAHLSNATNIQSSKSTLKKFIACKTQADVDKVMECLHFGMTNSKYIVPYTARHVPLPDLEAHCIEVAMTRLHPVAKGRDGLFSKTETIQLLSTISAFVHECIYNNRVYSNICIDHILRHSNGMLYFVSPDDEFSTSGRAFLPASLCHTKLICAVHNVRCRQLVLMPATIETMVLSALECMFELLVPLWAKYRHDNMIPFDTLAETAKGMQTEACGALTSFQYTSRILMNTLHLVPDVHKNTSNSEPVTASASCGTMPVRAKEKGCSVNVYIPKSKIDVQRTGKMFQTNI